MEDQSPDIDPRPPRHAKRRLAEQLISRDNQAWIFRGLILFFMTACWLFMDRHNDERYLKREAYTMEREQDRREAATAATSVSQLQAIRQQDHDLLTEMRNDIKWLRDQQHTR